MYPQGTRVELQAGTLLLIGWTNTLRVTVFDTDTGEVLFSGDARDLKRILKQAGCFGPAMSTR
ncbi:MAG: hypothetical protein HS116_02280 [Planctomycetes bacterium]|nr:hypothetical protein [Planctomycetota bacterium]